MFSLRTTDVSDLQGGDGNCRPTKEIKKYVYSGEVSSMTTRKLESSSNSEDNNQVCCESGRGEHRERCTY